MILLKASASVYDELDDANEAIEPLSSGVRVRVPSRQWQDPAKSRSSKRRRLLRGLARVTIAILLVLVAGSSEAAPPVRQVLILNSFDTGKLAFDFVSEDFRTELQRRSAEPVNFVQFVVSPAGFEVPPEQALVAYLLAAFADRPKPDVIVTVGGPAATFARKYRQQLFPGTPLLYGAVDRRYLLERPAITTDTEVAVANDYSRIIDDILSLLPDTSQVFVIVGSGQFGEFWRQELDRDFQRFQSRLTFTWSDDLSFAEIIGRAEKLPPHSAIVYVNFSVDAQQQAYSDRLILGRLHTTANAPLFGIHSTALGLGIVGGTLMSENGVGQRIADVALRILGGESPAAIRTPVQLPGPVIFDARELQRWGISESRLPPGSEVRFRSPSLWQEHRQAALVTLAALLSQSILIAGLLYQRRARHLAEVQSRRNLSLAADASRRATISALTGSIAHEVAQPLNSILHNAQAAEMLVSSNRATREGLLEILSDIRTADERATQIIERHRTLLRTRQLEDKPVDLDAVVRESLALLAHDMSAKRIRVEVESSSAACSIVGDAVLLQQVVVNLLINAVDAMADTPVDRRRLSVQSTVKTDCVELSVCDAGAGLSDGMDGRLFEPFVTTKTHGTGIGLTIAHSIVEAHRGTIQARNNAGGGATFIVTLPLAGATERV